MNIPEAIQVAVRHHATGRLAEAEQVYRQILALDARNLDALNNLAVIHGQRGHVEQAAECLRQALAVNPKHAPTHYNLGLAMEKLGRTDEAMTFYRNATEALPGYAAALNNLGLLLAAQGQLEEAAACYQQAVRSRPNHIEALTNLGNVLVQLARPAEAAACCQRAIALDPNFASAHFNLGLALLLSGDLARGWEEYEWRWQRGDVKSRHLPQLLWDGSDLAKRTLLLHTEQGFGDAIQFVRFVPLVAEKGARVIVECEPELETLFRGAAGVAKVIARGQPVPYHDAHAPLLSLPRHLGVTLQNLPAKVPYLAADPKRVERWRERLAHDGGAFRVGLVWAGKPSHKNDRNRSLALETLAPLGDVAGVTFYSLQKGATANATKFKLTDVASDLADFADTAALMANLDLVISADTAAAHLAGALARPVWTLLPFAPDWRWLLERDDSPWYPTMRLFRQYAAGDWPEVIGRVRQALETTVAAARQ